MGSLKGIMAGFAAVLFLFSAGAANATGADEDDEVPRVIVNAQETEGAEAREAAKAAARERLARQRANDEAARAEEKRVKDSEEATRVLREIFRGPVSSVRIDAEKRNAQGRAVGGILLIVAGGASAVSAVGMGLSTLSWGGLDPTPEQAAADQRMRVGAVILGISAPALIITGAILVAQGGKRSDALKKIANVTTGTFHF